MKSYCQLNLKTDVLFIMYIKQDVSFGFRGEIHITFNFLHQKRMQPTFKIIFYSIKNTLLTLFKISRASNYHIRTILWRSCFILVGLEV